MSAPRLIPAEVIALIFTTLAPKDLYRCMLVSRLWHEVAEARLYSNVTLNSSFQSHDLLVQAVKTRKCLLRRVEWISNNDHRVLTADLLDILFDYRPDEPIDPFRFSNDNETKTTSPLAQLVFPHGPDCPALMHFSFSGGNERWQFLDSVLYSLTTLTTLNLAFPDDGGAIERLYLVDMERILTTFPRLKELSIVGWRHFYPRKAAVALEGRDETTGPRVQHCLESFTFDAALGCSQEPPQFGFFRRLGNLKKVTIMSEYFDYENSCSRRPWALGRTLRQYCPKLESIDVKGSVEFWLFDLPILPSDQIRHITALVEETLSTNQSDFSVDLEQEMTGEDEARLIKQLQEQEVGELLKGRTAEPFFPQLKTLLLGKDHWLSAQDLLSLGVQAQFLTRLEVRFPVVQSSRPWDVYERRAPAAAMRATHSSIPTIDTLVENRRLQKRRPFTTRDLKLFLQLCSSLRFLSLTGCSFSFEDLIDTSTTATTGTPVIQRWACEETLETLDVIFNIPATNPEAHRLVWKHLGRFSRLRSLTLSQSVLIPSFQYGVDGLLEGQMGKSLEEIRQLPEWWKEQDRRQLMLWFARNFARLRILGMKHIDDVVDGQRRDTLSEFLDDEEVKQCSIRHVFIEDK
ncbi:hypothetical protein BG015_005665, partial [Linnemannia schmuckeri]